MSNTENNTTPPEQAPVTAPAVQPTQVEPAKGQEAAQAVPVASTTEDKSASAFIRMRQERRALKQRVAELEAAKPAPQPVQEAPAAPAPAPQVNQTPTPTQQAANPVAKAVGSEDEAIKALASDPDVGKIPGGIIEVLDMLDTDNRLKKLEDVDPKIAYSEAVKLWKERHGIAPAPAVPAPVKISGGISEGKADLKAIEAALDKATPGSKEYSKLVAQLNASLGITGRGDYFGR